MESMDRASLEESVDDLAAQERVEEAAVEVEGADSEGALAQRETEMSEDPETPRTRPGEVRTTSQAILIYNLSGNSGLRISLKGKGNVYIQAQFHARS